MAIKRSRKVHAEVHTSAMSDIMFFLFLFFLIISTLANPNVIKMDLPKAEAPDKTPNQHLSLSVTKDMKFFLDTDEILRENLEAALIQKTNELGDKTVVVRIPFDMEVQHLIDVLELGIKNDLKFVIATKGNS